MRSHILHEHRPVGSILSPRGPPKGQRGKGRWLQGTILPLAVTKTIASPSVVRSGAVCSTPMTTTPESILPASALYQRWNSVEPLSGLRSRALTEPIAFPSLGSPPKPSLAPYTSPYTLVAGSALSQ